MRVSVRLICVIQDYMARFMKQTEPDLICVLSPCAQSNDNPVSVNKGSSLKE